MATNDTTRPIKLVILTAITTSRRLMIPWLLQALEIEFENRADDYADEHRDHEDAIAQPDL